ncbi:MAG: glycosyltransferase family 4 protein [Deltaproteobacteria bacterium]|nr:glycosyltransferase family 4 protein [Deltaproteobacteria bacterium]
MATSKPIAALVGPELFPIPPIRGGASEQFIEQTARCLTRYRPVVIGVGDPELPGYEIRGRVEYFRVALTGWRRWLYKRHRRTFPYYDRRVAEIIRQVQPALIHVHNRPLLALFLKQQLPRLPVILHMHNLYNILGKRERPAPGTRIPVEAFAACSRFVLEREKDRLGAGAASHWVVYNGVDPAAFLPNWEHPDKIRELRRRYDLTDEPTVLFVGKIRQSKGVGVLLQAMEQVWRRQPRAVLILVGGTEFGRGRIDRRTPFLQELQNRLQQASGRVILTGFIPPSEVAQAYRLGDICVAPSQIDEGLPLVVLEASASGLPIISTKMGGIPEFVRDGSNGLLLENKADGGELAAKIVLLLENEAVRRKLGEQGRALVLERFSWQAVARYQEELYDTMLKEALS